MDYRPLGRTGISVSQLCLGAMMFGAFGNPDHDDSIRDHPRALDAGINFIDTADFYSAGESEEIVGKALAGGRRDDVVLATKVGLPFGEDPNHRGTSRRWITQAVEGSLRRLRHRLDRPLPGAPSRPGHRRRRDARRAVRPRPRGQDPRVRRLDGRRLGDRRGPVDRRAPRPRALPHRAAAVLDPDPRHRVRRAADLPAPRDGRADLQPAGRRLAVGRLPQGPGDRRPGLGRPRRSASPRATTPPRRRTPPSSTPPTPSARSPTRPG